MRHSTHHGYLVCFGTGRYLGLSDLGTTATQAIYGIWDYGDDPGESLGDLIPGTLELSRHPNSDVRLLRQTITGERTDGTRRYRTSSTNWAQYRTISDHLDPNPHQRDRTGVLPNPTLHIGWTLALPPGERVYQDVFIANNVLTVLAQHPSDAPCSGGGTTTVYTLNPCTGAMVDGASVNDTIQCPPTTVTTPAGDIWMFDKDTDPVTPPSDGVRPGLYFWRELP
jgi:type IV pilus assembly protein PilY1